MPTVKKAKKRKRTPVAAGAIYEDKKLKRFVRIDELRMGIAMVAWRRSTTGRFTEVREPIAVRIINSPRFKLVRAASE
jgi:hypothetical protein